MHEMINGIDLHYAKDLNSFLLTNKRLCKPKPILSMLRTLKRNSLLFIYFRLLIRCMALHFSLTMLVILILDLCSVDI